MVSTDETSTNFRGNDTHTQLQRGAVGSLTAFAVVADIRFIGMAAIGSALFASSAPTAPVERLRMETDNSIHPCAQSAQYKPAFTDTGLALQRLLPLHRHIHHLCPLAAQMGMKWQPFALCRAVAWTSHLGSQLSRLPARQRPEFRRIGSAWPMGLIYYGIGIWSARSDACGMWGAAPHAFGWSPGGIGL